MFQCDSATPACDACKTRNTTCVYASDPAVSRFAALKTAYTQLQSRYDDLWSLYNRPREGDAREAPALCERAEME